MKRKIILLAGCLFLTPPVWAQQVVFYQESDGMELERFPVGMVEESQELKNLNDHHPTCPCKTLHIPDMPFRNTTGKRWKVEGNTILEVLDTRQDATAKQAKQRVAEAKLMSAGITLQDLKDALGP